MILKMIFNFEQGDMQTPERDRSVPLAELREGDLAVLAGIDLPHQTAEHLMCLGFIPGVEVTVGKSGPGGDPRVYNVDGSNVALRSDVSANVTVIPKMYRTQG